MGTHMFSAAQRSVTSTKWRLGLAADHTSNDSRTICRMRSHDVKLSQRCARKKVVDCSSTSSGWRAEQKSGASAQRINGRLWLKRYADFIAVVTFIRSGFIAAPVPAQTVQHEAIGADRRMRRACGELMKNRMLCSCGYWIFRAEPRARVPARRGSRRRQEAQPQEVATASSRAYCCQC